MQPRHRRLDARPNAFQVMIGEPGMSGVLLVLLAVGIGLLLDFLVFNLHPIFSIGLTLLSVPVAQVWTIRRTLRMTQRNNPDYVRNLALASVAGQAGCTTVILVFLALFAGMWLDAQLDTHPVFTVGLILVAVPISLYAMIRLMLSSVASLNLAPPKPAARPDSSQPTPQSRTSKENGS
jgi:F0F1-type ATP synthase assembly protein I